jgi:hypothetical protein
MWEQGTFSPQDCLTAMPAEEATEAQLIHGPPTKLRQALAATEGPLASPIPTRG